VDDCQVTSSATLLLEEELRTLTPNNELYYCLNTNDWYGGRVPVAANTILLGKHWFYLVDNGMLLAHAKRFPCSPTWIAVCEHLPRETEKIYYGDKDPSRVEVLAEDDKNKIAVVKSTEGWCIAIFLKKRLAECLGS